MAANNNSMTQEKFEAIHAMKSGGMSAGKISKAVGMSVTSVYQALKFDNYEENRKWVYEYYKSRNSKKKNHSDVKQISMEYFDGKAKPDRVKISFLLTNVGKLLLDLAAEFDGSRSVELSEIKDH